MARGTRWLIRGARLFALLGVGLGGLAPTPSLAFQNEPEGFRGARFRMSQEEVLSVFPDMKLATEPVSRQPLDLAIYQLEDQSVLGLKPCTVKFRFFQNLLYRVSFDCGRGEEAVEALEKHFGEPTLTEEDAVYWLGKTRAVSLNPRARTFGFADLKLERALHGVLWSLTMGRAKLTAPSKKDSSPEADTAEGEAGPTGESEKPDKPADQGEGAETPRAP